MVAHHPRNHFYLKSGLHRGKHKEGTQVGVFLKICFLGELFFIFQVGLAKVTFEFLSWLNDELVGTNFFTVLLLTFVVGFTMFMLPPVPGVPVYIFCGIVVAKQGEAFVGFPAAVAIAIACSLFLKLVACTGQYSIGYRLGQNVKVQQLFAVDSDQPRHPPHPLTKDDSAAYTQRVTTSPAPTCPVTI